MYIKCTWCRIVKLNPVRRRYKIVSPSELKKKERPHHRSEMTRTKDKGRDGTKTEMRKFIWHFNI